MCDTTDILYRNSSRNFGLRGSCTIPGSGYHRAILALNIGHYIMLCNQDFWMVATLKRCHSAFEPLAISDPFKVDSRKQMSLRRGQGFPGSGKLRIAIFRLQPAVSGLSGARYNIVCICLTYFFSSLSLKYFFRFRFFFRAKKIKFIRGPTMLNPQLYTASKTISCQVKKWGCCPSWQAHCNVAAINSLYVKES